MKSIKEELTQKRKGAEKKLCAFRLCVRFVFDLSVCI